MNEARSENRAKGQGVYYEAHHIVPECLGGEGKSYHWKTHPNIVLLTAKEHFMAHYYLMKIHPNIGKLTYAFWRMCSGSGNQNRDYVDVENFTLLYEEGRIRQAEQSRQMNRERKPSYETKVKMAAAKVGRKQSLEHKANRAATCWRNISQCTKEGHWIADWNSIKEASENLGINRQPISSCLRGITKTAGGFIFKYK